ncbi:MAG: hypothetical protein ACC628_25690, partial [Pirellulaceae bacterium]
PDLLGRLRSTLLPNPPPSQRNNDPDQPAADASDPQPDRAATGESGLGEQQAERRRLRVARIQQNVERATHETMDVAQAFETILQELVNNRIDTEVLRRRLGRGIVEPLRAIGEKMLPELKEQIGSLHPVGASDAADVEAVRNATARADTVLLEMQRVLERMLELESFHEVLDMLRAIIRDQEALNKKTRQERSKSLRGLLEE